ncbi:MAG: hypothetical protein K6A64_08475 [Bacteroidales bacterium]|nr:hypothetical protein [Bacteroidales bacterium]
MNRILCAAIAIVAILKTALPGHNEDTSISVMFWNLENYFDWRNDSTSVSDAEFSSRGERHWTLRRFNAKSNAITKGILWVAAESGSMPDAIGLAEVENVFVLRKLIGNTALQKLDYEIVHYDSPDRRGIDVALLYRQSTLTLTGSKPCHLYDDSTSAVLPTRDILLATFIDREGRPLAILVNHHPSKYGGAEASETRRRTAISTLKTLADSLVDEGFSRIVAIGDFNDTPDNPVFDELSPTLENLSLPLSRRGLGTIKYDGKWEMIDLCFVSGPLVQICTLSVFYLRFLMISDREHGGYKPFRTYSGPRYLGGVSDHCPILLHIK